MYSSRTSGSAAVVASMRTRSPGTMRAECSTSTFANFATRGSATKSSFVYYQCFTNIERIPENRGVGVAHTPVFGLLLFRDLLSVRMRKLYHRDFLGYTRLADYEVPQSRIKLDPEFSLTK